MEYCTYTTATFHTFHANGAVVIVRCLADLITSQILYALWCRVIRDAYTVFSTVICLCIISWDTETPFRSWFRYI